MVVSLPRRDSGSGGRGRGHGAPRAGGRGAAAGRCARQNCSRGRSLRPNLPTAHPIPLHTWSRTTMRLPPSRKRLAPPLLTSSLGGMTSRPYRTQCSASPSRPERRRGPEGTRIPTHRIPQNLSDQRPHRETMTVSYASRGSREIDDRDRLGPCVRSYPKIGHPTKNHQTTPPPRDNNGQ